MKYVIDVNQLEEHKVPKPFERAMRVALAPDTQEVVKDVSVIVAYFSPYSGNDMHTHEGTELLYVVSGYGKAIIGDETYEIKPDSLIVAPPGIPHQQINDSGETMKLITIWTPPVTGKDVVARAHAARQAVLDAQASEE